MFRFYILVGLLFIIITAIGTGNPTVRYTIGVKESLHSAQNVHLIQQIGIIVDKEEYDFITRANNVYKNSKFEILLRKRNAKDLKLDFYIEDIISNSNTIFIKIWESQKNSPHFIEVDKDNFSDLYKRFANLFKQRTQQEIYGVEDEIDLRLDLSDRDFFYLKALKFYSQHQYLEAIKNLDTATKKSWRDHKSFYLRALCFKKLQDSTSYKVDLDKAIALNDNVGNYIIELGNFYLNNGKVLQAIACYKKFEDDPKYYDLAAWNTYVSYIRLNQNDEAFSHLKRIDKESRFYTQAQSVLENESHHKAFIAADSTKKAAEAKNKKEGIGSVIKTIQIAVQIIAILTFISFLSFLVYKGYKEKGSLLQQKAPLIGLIISIITFLLSTFDNLFKLFF